MIPTPRPSGRRAELFRGGAFHPLRTLGRPTPRPGPLFRLATRRGGAPGRDRLAPLPGGPRPAVPAPEGRHMAPSGEGDRHGTRSGPDRPPGRLDLIPPAPSAPPHGPPPAWVEGAGGSPATVGPGLRRPAGPVPRAPRPGPAGPAGRRGARSAGTGRGPAVESCSRPDPRSRPPRDSRSVRRVAVCTVRRRARAEQLDLHDLDQ